MLTDAEAIRRVLDGDADRFGELVMRYQAMVEGACRTLLRDDHDVLDAAQDAFVRAYQALPQLKDPRRLGGWLRRIARSVCMSRLQKRGTAPAGQLAEAEVADTGPGPAEHAEGRELANAVLAAIARLPVKYRRPIRMFYLDGASHRDIAGRLGLRAGCVRTRLHRGRELLRSDLSACRDVEAMSRSKHWRGWLPASLIAEEFKEMALEYEKTKRRLLRSDEEVTIRPMTGEDIPAVRRFDIELTATLDDVNAAFPPGGHSTCPGGPWSDDRELLEHFEKYTRRGNITLLAEDDTGRVVGFADLWAADEPEPFGRSVDVECIDYFREYFLAGLETLLLAEAEKVARAAGLGALDIGTNTCSGEYISLRRFGLKVFYEYDDVLCRCDRVDGAPRPGKRMLTPAGADLTGLVRASHWSPTDFTFRCNDERAYIAELSWPDKRAILELWRYQQGRDSLPVPENPPNRSELYVQPEALRSPQAMSEILTECAALAGEAGADQIALPCPSEVPLDEDKVDVIDRGFRYAWLRKRL